MKCLVDLDVLHYELCCSAEYFDEDLGEQVVMSFDWVVEALEQRLKEIEEECWADEPSVLFLTNSETLNGILNRRRKREGLPEKPFNPNFREKLATKKPYKGNRKSEKPFHYVNFLVYVLEYYDVVVADGLEADDLMAIEQTKAEPNTTIICTRDKDLRMVEGMHFGWPCGRQPQYGPKEVKGLGELELNGSKLKGCGKKFFYSQLITGDAVDNIPGLPRGGPAMAYKLLGDAEGESECYERVRAKYEEKYPENWEEELTEQANLLWMVRELDEDGRPILWERPSE